MPDIESELITAIRGVEFWADQLDVADLMGERQHIEHAEQKFFETLYLLSGLYEELEADLPGYCVWARLENAFKENLAKQYAAARARRAAKHAGQKPGRRNPRRRIDKRRRAAAQRASMNWE